MGSIFKTLFLALLVASLIFILSAALIGIGYLFTLFLPLSLFQASLLVVLVAFIPMFAFALVVFVGHLMGLGDSIPYLPDWLLDEDELDDDEDPEEHRGMPWDVDLTPDKVKAQFGRNRPCPCGSGKKFKNCCGKQKRDAH